MLPDWCWFFQPLAHALVRRFALWLLRKLEKLLNDPIKVPGDTFGAKLQYLRDAKGFGQRELARRAGMHRVTLWRLERGDFKAPTWQTVCRLADVLGVSVADFR